MARIAEKLQKKLRDRFHITQMKSGYRVKSIADMLNTKQCDLVIFT